MNRYPRFLFAIAGATLLLCAPLGCSDDDDPAGPGGGSPADQTAPLVTEIDPSDRDTDVPVDEAVVILFSEPMDKGTATGNVTLSVGAVSSLDWNAAGTELAVSHDPWPEGTTVTVTVGTGLTDAAGNALPQAFTSLFYTFSSTPVVLDTLLPGGEGAMLTNASPVFFFSAHMNRASILANSQVTQPPGKVVPEYSVGMWNGDVKTATFDFASPLDPLAEYTITIFGTAQAADGTPIGDEVTLTFTTGAAADETGPQILSVAPAVDATVPVDLASFTITFSEPINPGQVQPTAVAALLEMFVAIEPVWNATFDEMTVYLQRPLPAGVRLFAIFEPDGFMDLAGNGNAETDSLSFTTQGTASLLPVRDDLKLYYNHYDDGRFSRARQTLVNVSGDAFDRVINLWSGAAFDDLDMRWSMAWQADGLVLRTVHEDEGPVGLSPGVRFLPVTMIPHWSGSSQVSGADVPLTFTYSCMSSGPSVRNYHGDDSKAGPAAYPLFGCYDVEMEYAIITGDEEPVETGFIGITFAPGLGIIEMYDYGQQYEDEEVVDSWDESYYLYGASLDDRYEEYEGFLR